MMTSKCSCSRVRRILSEITVEPVLLLYMLSTFSQYSLFQDLVYSKVCSLEYGSEICDNLHSPGYHTELEYVQRTSSHWILLSTTSLVFPSILISIYLGSWSDRYGPKWPVVFPPLGGIMACLVYITISFKPQSSVAWICLASALSGLSGGFASCIMSCMTYVAAVSSKENRTVRLSRLEAMTFVGGTVGPFISGSMLEVTGHGYAFFFMMICYCLAFLYAVFVVREIHGENQQCQPPGGVLPVPDLVPTNIALNNEQQTHLLVDSQLAPSDNEEEDEKEPNGYNDEPIEEKNETGKRTEKKRMANNRNKSIPSSVRIENENNHSSRPSIGSGGSSNGSSRNSSGRNDDSGSGSGYEDERRIVSSNHHRTNQRTNREVTQLPNDAGQNRNSPKICNESESTCSDLFGVRHLLDAVKTAWKKREDNKRLYLNLVIAASFITMMITAGEMDVAYLFARDTPLVWSYQTYSYYFGMKYGLGAFSLLLGMPLMKRFDLADSTICIIGIVSRMAGLLLYGVSFNSYMAFLVPVVAVFSFFTIPAARALLSKLVAPSEQGKMFAFVAIMEDLCTLFASILFNSLYPVTRPILHGFIFLVAAGLLIIPVCILWFVGRRMSQPSLPYEAHDYETASSFEPSLETHHGTGSRRSVTVSDDQ